MTSPAQAQALRMIFVQNDCPRPVQFFIHHADRPSQWHPHGWFKLDGNRGTRLRVDGTLLRQLEDHDLYMYAETIDNGTTVRWQGGGPGVSMDGGLYRTMKVVSYRDKDGDFSVRLTCH